MFHYHTSHPMVKTQAYMYLKFANLYISLFPFFMLVCYIFHVYTCINTSTDLHVLLWLCLRWYPTCWTRHLGRSCCPCCMRWSWGDTGILTDCSRLPPANCSPGETPETHEQYPLLPRDKTEHVLYSVSLVHSDTHIHVHRPSSSVGGINFMVSL